MDYIDYTNRYNSIREMYKYSKEKIDTIKKDVTEIEDSCKCLDNYIDEI